MTFQRPTKEERRNSRQNPYSTPSGSPMSSAENSPVSVSSVSDIENSTYAQLTKNRKIGPKVKAVMKFSEEAISRDFRSLYLPSFTQTWASSGNFNFLKSKIAPYVSGRNLSSIVWILTPIHVNGNHWGLLCLNMVLRQIFYDDGLKWNPHETYVKSSKG